MHRYDGSPIPHGHLKTSVVGEFPQYSIAGVRVGVIVGRLFVDEPGNRSKKWVEYSVRDVTSGEVYDNVRALASQAGAADGGEIVLHPATRNNPGVAKPFGSNTRAVDADGDLVILGFAGGVSDHGLILGVLPHVVSGYGAKSTDGERQISIHKGTTIERRSDGSYEISRSNVSIKIDASNGDVTIAHSSGAKILVDDQGVVTLDGVASSGILLGVGATESAVHGDAANAQVMAPIASADGALQVALLAAQATLATPTLPSAIAALTAVITALQAYASAEQSAAQAFPGTLSSKVKVG